MTRVASSRWFALADLAAALGATGLCVIAPGLAGWPLLVALVPWLVRALVGSRMVPRTPLDVPLVVFGLTALVGAFVAYSPVAAWSKAWLILGGVLLFYAVARQPRENLWPIAGGLAVLAGVLSTAVLLSRIWTSVWLPDSEASTWWSVAVHALLGDQATDPIQGILTMLLAFPAALVMCGYRRRRWRPGILAAMASVVTVAGLASTGSMSALWSILGGCGLACVFGIGLLWRRRRRATVMLLAVGAVGVSLAAAIGVARMTQWSLSGTGGTLPGINDVLSRVEVARQCRYLIEDYLWTGAGLASFPGQYSQYIMGVPVVSQDSSHDVYLSVALEQGAFGLLALVWIWAGSIRLLISRRVHAGPNETGLVAAATVSGLSLLALHGLAEDAIYGTQAAPLLFLLPGFAVALGGQGSREADETPPSRSSPPHPKGRSSVTLLAGLAIGLVAAVLGVGRPIVSSVQSNLGALAMARQQLSDWPTGEWDDGDDVASLRPAEVWFERALRWEAENRSAHYRLGLIRLLHRDFNDAVDHLSQASQLSPDHRGVRKTLGFAMGWAGYMDEAVEVLRGIPEARRELKIYVWWWGSQGRQDLAVQAEQLVARLPIP